MIMRINKVLFPKKFILRISSLPKAVFLSLQYHSMKLWNLCSEALGRKFYSLNFLSVAAAATAVVVVSKKDYDDDNEQQRVVTEKITHTKDFLPSKGEIFKPLLP